MGNIVVGVEQEGKIGLYIRLYDKYIYYAELDYNQDLDEYLITYIEKKCDDVVLDDIIASKHKLLNSLELDDIIVKCSMDKKECTSWVYEIKTEVFQYLRKFDQIG